MVERLPRTLMTSPMEHPDPHKWARYLPLVLLSISATTKKDLGYSSAERNFGAALWLPENFICHSTPVSSEASASHIKTAMFQLATTPPRKSSSTLYVHKSLLEAKLVFFSQRRKETTAGPVRWTLLGHSLKEKEFLSRLNGKEDRISVGHL